MALVPDVTLTDVASFHAALLFTKESNFEKALQILNFFSRRETIDPKVIELAGIASLRRAIFPSELPPGDRELIYRTGRAVMTAALDRGIAPAALDHFEAVPGRGVRATLSGDSVLVGNLRLLEENNIDVGFARARVGTLETLGRTVVLVSRGQQLLGLLAFGDTLRPEAAHTVAALHKLGIKTMVISGDNAAATRRVAAQAGIADVHAELLPQDKAALIRKLQQTGNVAMVGDGINDAPALMQANVGIAMGGGTDIAIDAADIIILSNRLDSVLDAREISRWSYRKMVQNVSLAVAFNGIGVPVAATGMIFPIWAMAAMAVSVTAIFMNSLRGKPALFFDAILSVGHVRTPPQAKS